MTARIFLMIGAILAGLSVALGAFASHALRSRLTDRALEIFEIGTRYQMYHALALILVALLLSRTEPPSTFLKVAGWAFSVGVLLFCSSLYALSFTDIKWLGAIAPVGGAAFILGWACVALSTGSLK